MNAGVFIAGRLNSERLNNKLILPIGDTCLWEIACEKLNSLPNNINKYALAEKGQLSEIGKKYDNIQIIERDDETANIDGPLSYIFKELKHVEDDHLMFLNPCQSFLSIETILNSLRLFAESSKDSATSVVGIKNWFFDKTSKPMNKIDYKRLSTKEVEIIWMAAHCFHIFNKNKFFNTGKMLDEESMLIPVPEIELYDVDTKKDYEYVRWLYEVRNRH
jgi:CMP-N-acetylneuraminic acid synthetase